MQTEYTYLHTVGMATIAITAWGTTQWCCTYRWQSMAQGYSPALPHCQIPHTPSLFLVRVKSQFRGPTGYWPTIHLVYTPIVPNTSSLRLSLSLSLSLPVRVKSQFRDPTGYWPTDHLVCTPIMPGKWRCVWNHLPPLSHLYPPTTMSQYKAALGAFHNSKLSSQTPS